MKLEKVKLQEYQKLLTGLDPIKILTWSVDFFGVNKIAFASSLGIEDQVLTDMISKMQPEIQSKMQLRPMIVVLDTGRLPEETHLLIAKCRKRYQINYLILHPNAEELSQMTTIDGPNLFYESVEQRKKCCLIRKVNPLSLFLNNLEAWICGLRQEQAASRSTTEVIEWDQQFGLMKINPLFNWTWNQTWEYVRKNNVPYNPMHDQGYPSIGCAPCTRAINPGEDIRAGRWWWENSEHSEHKECGLHLSPRNT